MRTFQIKVCGNNNLDNFRSLVELKPDYVGFIFYEKSKRYLEDESLFSIFPNAQKVGVFVNESISIIIQKVVDYKLDVVQLHGDETVEFCEQLILEKNKFVLDFKIWKAIGIKSEEDFKQLIPYQQFIDTFVFDTKSNIYGGTGKKFDWELLINYKLSTPFLLSGGIKLEDAPLLKNFQHSKCVGFDINSGFETEPGIKKIEQVKEFISIIDERV